MSIATILHRRPKHAAMPELELSPGAKINQALDRPTEMFPALPADDRKPQAAPSFTPAPVAPTGPMPSLARPYAPSAAHPEPRPAQDALPLKIFERAVAEVPGFGLLPCSGCGAEYRDAGDMMLRRMKDTAIRAGWACDGWGRWHCPACLASLDLAVVLKYPPVLAGGSAAEAALLISARTERGAYDDLTARADRWDRTERRRRRAAMLAINERRPAA